MDQLGNYLANVEKRKSEIVAFLKELVKTPSLSGEEGAIAGKVSDKLTELGYKVDVDGMGNIIAQRGKGQRNEGDWPPQPESPLEVCFLIPLR